MQKKMERIHSVSSWTAIQNYSDFETGELCLLHKVGKSMT